jgi:hypothetical protein
MEIGLLGTLRLALYDWTTANATHNGASMLRLHFGSESVGPVFSFWYLRAKQQLAQYKIGQRSDYKGLACCTP